eukprot:s3306_g2.t1
MDSAAAALRDVGDTRGEAFALLQEVGSAYLDKNEVDSALRVASAALRQLRTCEDLSGEVTALKATAEIHLTRGDTEPALRLLQEVVSLCRDSGDVEDQVDALIRIARLWVLRSEAEEATKAAKSALEAAQGAKKDLAEAQALLGLAGVLKAKTDLAGAQTEAGKAEKLFKKCGHRPGELAALMLSWSAMVEEGPQQVAQVVQAAKKAAEAFKSAGDQQCAAEALLEASAASREHGQVEESASTAAAALQLFRQLGHTSGEVKALGAVSAAERARGRVAESVKAAVDVVSLYQRRGDTRGQAEATCELAKVHLALGLLKDALSEVGEACLLFQKLGLLQIQEAVVLVEVGVPTLMALNDPPKAVAMAEDAAKLYRAFGDRKGEAAALSACAKVCVQQGDNASALQAARQAVAVLSRARLAREEAEALHLIARVYAIRREAREAVSSAAQALSLLRRPGDEAERADVLTTASCVHSMGLESEGAVAAAEEAVGLCRRLGDKKRLAAALHALAEGLLLKQDYGQAVDTAEEALQVSGLDPQLQALKGAGPTKRGEASDGLCWLLLPASLLWRSQLILGAGEERWVLAYRHRFAMLLPVALLAPALRIFLGMADGVDTGPIRAGLLRLLGALLIAASCVQDALSYGTADWPEPFLGLALKLQSLKTFQETSVFHVSELLFVIGFQLLLRESAARERPAAGCRWSWISALARLSLGMNLSNLFVFHFIAGFYLQEPQALTPTSALLSFAAVYAISATLALLAMVAVEIPAMTLLGAQISETFLSATSGCRCQLWHVRVREPCQRKTITMACTMLATSSQVTLMSSKCFHVACDSLFDCNNRNNINNNNNGNNRNNGN